jgi:hypothetical protein
MVALQMPRLPQCIGRGGSFFCFPDQAFRHHGAERDSRHEKEDSIYGQIFIEKSRSEINEVAGRIDQFP